jgi:hypothetical protein
LETIVLYSCRREQSQLRYSQDSGAKPLKHRGTEDTEE